MYEIYYRDNQNQGYKISYLFRTAYGAIYCGRKIRDTKHYTVDIIDTYTGVVIAYFTPNHHDYIDNDVKKEMIKRNLK